MKRKKLLTMVLACSLIFGQTVWAAEPVTDVTAESAAEENVAGTDEEEKSFDIKEEADTAEANSAAEETKGEDLALENDQQEVQEEKTGKPKLAADTEGQQYEEQTVYIGTSLAFEPEDVITMNDPEEWDVVSSAPEICKASLKIVPSRYGGNRLYIVLEGVEKGSALVTVNLFGNPEYVYQVNVSDKPDNIVSFADPMLGLELTNTMIYTSGTGKPADTNGDGYMSVEEMQEFTSISLGTAAPVITDLTGLEYATNVTRVYLDNQSELVNVDALHKMENLSHISLTGTKVSIEDRFGLAKFRDLSLEKGSRGNPISNGDFFDTPLNVECIEGDNVVIYQQDEYSSYILLAIEAGDATVRLSLDGYYEDIRVHVEGIRSDQPIGEASNTDIMAMGGDRILGSNGTLWEFYPEVEKIRDDVDTYVAGWVYSGKDAMEYKYYTDQEGTLWSDNGELAKDSVQYTGHYSLDSEGILTDIYNSQKTEVAGVKKWVEDRVSQGYDNETNMRLWKTTTYVLKNDGTLWSRLEVEKDQSVHSFEQFASDVKDINEDGYLTNTGEYYLWSDLEEPAMTNVGIIPVSASPSYYTGLDGNAYIYIYPDYVNVGKGEIVSMIDEAGEYYYLMADGNLYCLDEETKESRKVDSGVVQLIGGYSSYADDCYMTEDGQYKRLTGEKATAEDPINVYVTGQYTLEDTGIAGDYMLKQNGVNMLTHVKKIYKDVYDPWQLLAVRTDATVWDVEDGMAKLLDLDLTVALGDLDGDGEVTISDLRLTLRAVCKKVTLTEEQETAADVEKDNNNVVDIKDLRKMLRFICKKIDSLE